MDNRRDIHTALEAVYETHSRRVLATLIRLLGDFDQAEEALQDAFAAAVDQWPRKGMPDNPRAWLVSAGRFKAIDRLRRASRQDQLLTGHTVIAPVPEREPAEAAETGDVDDDQLRLIFICCHPALTLDARVALTLREVCGLTTEQVASACLARPATIAQRIVRAKRKIRDAGIPYEVPDRSELPARLEGVLRVVYLVFNEGYSASSGDHLTRPDLSREAIRLGRLLEELLPDPEVRGLLALMLLQESRRHARTDSAGELVRLEDQDRELWDRNLITEGIERVNRIIRAGRFGSYTIQAAIAAVHARAKRPIDTDWQEIVSLYDILLRLEPSPVVALNRAVAVAMARGPEAGLVELDQADENGQLDDYYLSHAARADFCQRLGRIGDARQAYKRALSLTRQGPEQRFLAGRLKSLAPEDEKSCRNLERDVEK